MTKTIKPAKPTRSATKATPRGKTGKSVLGYGDLGQSLLYMFPLLLIYAIGITLAPTGGNGVDFLTRGVYAALGYSQRNYIILYAVLTALFAAVVFWMRKAGTFSGRKFLLLIVESAVVALTLGSFIYFIMHKLLGFGVKPDHGGFAGIVASAGAGVHEELVFRLGVFAGGAALLKLIGVGHRTALFIAGLASSIVFSLVHFMGVYGDPWALDTFVYRSLAGAAFATIFYFRSLAHAAWSHALYDVYVIVILGSS